MALSNSVFHSETRRSERNGSSIMERVSSVTAFSRKTPIPATRIEKINTTAKPPPKRGPIFIFFNMRCTVIKTVACSGQQFYEIFDMLPQHAPENPVIICLAPTVTIEAPPASRWILEVSTHAHHINIANGYLPYRQSTCNFVNSAKTNATQCLSLDAECCDMRWHRQAPGQCRIGFASGGSGLDNIPALSCRPEKTGQPVIEPTDKTAILDERTQTCPDVRGSADRKRGSGLDVVDGDGDIQFLSLYVVWLDRIGIGWGAQ